MNTDSSQMQTGNRNPDAIKTSIKKTAYLFGNGINRQSGDDDDLYSWGNLLVDLNREYASSSIKDIRAKPFPMVYDEIVNYSFYQLGTEEKEIKDFIKIKLDKLLPNDRFRDFSKLKCDEILTTNYEYLIEKALNVNWQRAPINKKEYYYSLFRTQVAAGRKVWHIHGEQADKRSILLGYRHYINYASKVKAYADNIFSEYKKGSQHEHTSWVGLFFTHDIRIVGFGLDFSEHPIWWLLAFRRFKQISERTVDINNEITLVIPSFSKVGKQKTLDMLQAYGVKTKIIDVAKDDYDRFYQKILNNGFESK